MTLQETVENQELAALDLTQVAALQQKRTIAFVNHFVTTTVQFLNNFMKKCEHRLMNFERKLEKVEASMVLLEARLSSIPEINTGPEEKPQEQTNNSTDTTGTTELATTESTDPQTTDSTKDPENTEIKNPSEEVKPSYPEYDRFVKMVQVGVPLEAVKLKVSLEGLDPEIFVKVISK